MRLAVYITLASSSSSSGLSSWSWVSESKSRSRGRWLLRIWIATRGSVDAGETTATCEDFRGRGDGSEDREEECVLDACCTWVSAGVKSKSHKGM